MAVITRFVTMKLKRPIDLNEDEIPNTPLLVHQGKVLPEWIDYNGHMNVAYYVMVFDHATDGMFDMIDIGIDHVKRDNGSMFVLETHVNYLQEVDEGAPLDLTCQMIDADEKRLHLYFEMHHGEEGFLSATSELMALHVDMNTRRTAPFLPDAQARINAIMAQHKDLPKPERVGQTIGIRRKS